MLGKNYAYYLGGELKYGTNLYLSGWKKLLFHPLQLIKDTASALYHPIQTGKILLNELKLHPIGMAVNISLSWVTGRVVSSSIHYVSTLNSGASSSTMPTLLQNSTNISDTAISSISQAVQVGSQAMGGGCCGGICTTTAARISQTTSFISSQSASSENNKTLIPREDEMPAINKEFFPYFNSCKKPKKHQYEKCNDMGCPTDQSASQEMKAKSVRVK